MLVGDAGSGKSRLLRELEHSPPRGMRGVYVPVPTLVFDDLATWCVETVGGASSKNVPADFGQWISQAPEGVLLLIDDADHLPPDTASQLAAAVGASDGALVVVAGACPGDAADEVARRLRVEQTIELTQPGAGLVHLGEIQSQLLRGEPRAPMARVAPSPAPPRPQPLAAAAPPLIVPEPDEPAVGMRAALDAAPDIEPEPEPLSGAEPPPPEVAASQPIAAALELALSWAGVAKLAGAAVAVAFLIGVAYQLGRQSVQLLESPATAPPEVSAAPPEFREENPPAVATGSALEAAVIAAPQAFEGPPAPTASKPVESKPPVAAEVVTETPIERVMPAPEQAVLSAAVAAVVDAESAADTGPGDAVPAAPLGPREVEEALNPDGTAPAYETASVVATTDAVGLSPEPPTTEAETLDPDVVLIVPRLSRRALPAPPPPAPATDDGWIEVESLGGKRAQVWIDGTSAGVTPIERVSLAPGKHRITLRTQDGKRIRQTVEVRPGRGSRVRLQFD